jgi:TolB-like protein/AraC-like DNA-binding protein
MIFYLVSDNDFINKLSGIIIKNIASEDFGVEKLVEESGLNHSYIRRRLKSIKGKTISQFICEVRLQQALQILQHEKVTASEVAFMVGFGSPAYFNTCFHEFYGFPPGETKKRFLNVSESDNSAYKTNQITTILTRILKSRQRVALITSAAIFMIIVLGYFIYPNFLKRLTARTFPRLKNQEKSIAVLPFINDSPDSSNVYFINGVTENITDNLSRIKDLTVVSRTTMEKYRNNNTKSIRQIALEVGANYIVEGSCQKIGNQVLLSIQLIDSWSDKHLMSEKFEEKYEDVFNLYSKIAFEVASKINALITAEETDLIKKPPTNNIMAFRLLTQGTELLEFGSNYQKRNNRFEYFDQAEDLFNRAIQLDSTFSDVYVQLGFIYKERANTDSSLFMAKKALHFDIKNPKAYYLIGEINRRILKNETEAEIAYRNAIKFNPNYALPYHGLGGLYYGEGEFSKGLGYLLQSLKLLGNLNQNLSNFELGRLEYSTLHLFRSLLGLGFFEDGIKYGNNWLQLSHDDYNGYIYNIMWGNIINCHFERVSLIADENRDKEMEIPMYHHYTGLSLLFLKKYGESVDYLKKGSEKYRDFKNRDIFLLDYYLAFALLQTGKKEEAGNYFKPLILNCQNRIKTETKSLLPTLHYTVDDYQLHPRFILMCTFSALGEKEKALENMRWLRKNYPVYDLQVITFLKYFPMLDNIRNEPEFMDYLHHAETRYFSERKKCEELLRKEGIIR